RLAQSPGGRSPRTSGARHWETFRTSRTADTVRLGAALLPYTESPTSIRAPARDRARTSAEVGVMPDSYGKRARRDANAKKAAAREERRIARAQRKNDREAGLIEKGVPIGPAEQSEFLPGGGASSALDVELEEETEAAE